MQMLLLYAIRKQYYFVGTAEQTTEMNSICLIDRTRQTKRCTFDADDA